MQFSSSDRTIVVFTADYGEMSGAHGLPGKGPYPTLCCQTQDVNAAHESILFTYSGLGAVDSGFFKLAAEAKAAGNKPISAIVKNRYVPDLKKRGSVLMAFDSRYKFTRYCSPLDHHTPKTLHDLYRDNDNRASRSQGRPRRNDQPRRGPDRQSQARRDDDGANWKPPLPQKSVSMTLANCLTSRL